MIRRSIWAALAALMLPSAALAQIPPVPGSPSPSDKLPTASCAALAARAMPAATEVRADLVAAGAYSLPPSASGGFFAASGMNLAGRYDNAPNPEFCRVSAVLKPSAASHIRTEVWLPSKGWNGKMIGVGNFGWGGSLPYGGMLTSIQAGYAAAGNDTGHDNSAPDAHGGKFLLGNPEGMIDYAWRANHEMTLKAKALIAGYYGEGPRKSYWIGCSLGGLQGLIEAKRFPEDYDGIVAGAPPNPLALFNAAQLWPNYLIARDRRRAMTQAKLALVTNAAIKACASPAGLAAGYIDNPAACRFDPAVLQCKGGDAPDCLTAPQVWLMRQTWRGPGNPRTGKVWFPGPAVGSETTLWPFMNGTEFVNALDLYRYAAFQTPSFTAARMDWNRDVASAVAKVGPLMHVDADLTAFTARGGRLLLYVGWNDYHNPTELADYLKAVSARIGEKADHYVRLVQIPGMNHCAGGPGCDTFDKIEMIDRWADRKAGRSGFTLSRIENGKPVRTRPVCFYPSVATYKGTGSTDDAANFTCTAS